MFAKNKAFYLINKNNMKGYFTYAVEQTQTAS